MTQPYREVMQVRARAAGGRGARVSLRGCSPPTTPTPLPRPSGGHDRAAAGGAAGAARVRGPRGRAAGPRDGRAHGGPGPDAHTRRECAWGGECGLGEC